MGGEKIEAEYVGNTCCKFGKERGEKAVRAEERCGRRTEGDLSFPFVSYESFLSTFKY